MSASGESPRTDRAADPEAVETVGRELGGGRAELVVAALLVGSAGCGVGFVVAYALDASTQWLGLAMGAALGLLAIAAILAAARVLPREQAVERRARFGDPRNQALARAEIEQGGEGISRRRLLLGAMGASLAALGAAIAAPLASLGPSTAVGVGSSPWRRGVRLVDGDGRALTPDDVALGTFVTAFPQGEARATIGSAVVVVRLAVEELDLPIERADWAPEGLLAFSKTCTHAGCAINLFRHPLYEPTSDRPALVCPCHYSTFDPAVGGEPIFGPAARALPQLPLELGADGELVAGGGFSGPVGPSYPTVRGS